MLRRSAAPVLATAFFAGLTTVLVIGVPQFHFAYRQHEVHVGFDSAAAIIGLLVAYLLFGRFQRRRRLDDLVLFVALSIFALSNLFFAALPTMFFDVGSGKFSTWAPLTGRLLAAATLAFGAFAPRRPVHLSRRATGAVLLIPVAVLALTALVVGALVSVLPSGVEAELSPEASGRPRLIGHPAVLVVQLMAGALFAAAAVGFTRRSEREGDAFVRLLAVASVLGAFARLHYFLYPSLYTEWVYTGDVFRLLFYVVVLGAALREISSYWRAAAHAAVLEERRRLARDLHDGVAQELAIVGMNLKRLDQTNPHVQRAAGGVERGLDDARRAMATLREPVNEPLNIVLARAARDIAAREGAEVDLSLASEVDAPPETREGLVRILSEAITNAVRHRRADLVRVELEGGKRLSLRVRDNGTRFDPTATRRDDRGGYGVGIMRESAVAIGGDFRITTKPGGGTEIEVVL